MRILSSWLQLLCISSILLGCHHHDPLDVIVLPDVSGSIESSSTKSMGSALQRTIDRLQRGDSLTVIPIMSDADIDLPGRILRFTIPMHREAFDFDLKKVRLEAKESLQQFQAQALEHPAIKSDLLRTLRAASEEVAAARNEHRAAIIGFSDFIQDDGQFDFKTNPRLQDPEHARRLADELAQNVNPSLKDLPVYLGYLGSKDLRHLNSLRRQAIEAFWIEYLTKQGARPTVAMDGPGSLAGFLDSLEDRQTSIPSVERALGSGDK